MGERFGSFQAKLAERLSLPNNGVELNCGPARWQTFTSNWNRNQRRKQVAFRELSMSVATDFPRMSSNPTLSIFMDGRCG